MVRSNDPFWNDVEDMNDGSIKCKFCGHLFAKDTSISRIKWHFSGQRGHGVGICGLVPKEVQEAAFLAMRGGKKRHKSIPSSSNDYAIPTCPQEQDNAGDAGRMQVGVQGMEQSGWRERIHSHVDMENTVTLGVDAHESRGEAGQGTDVVDQFGDGSWVQIHSALSMAPKLNEIDTYLMLDEEDKEPGERARSSRILKDNTSETRGVPFPTSSNKPVGQAFEENRKMIWSLLKNDEVSTIGIYGMGGVGKTTLLQHIRNELQQRPDICDHVWWVTVSQDFSINRLQNLIAKRLELDLSSEDDDLHRAAKLSEELRKKQKWILILDDLWNSFELHDVGIHSSFKGCKLILTTRLQTVCDQIDCQHKIKLKPLLEGESWTLFKENLRCHMALSDEVKGIAKAVARKCAGLPLGIITVAGSLRGVDDPHQWRNTLKKLKDSETGDMKVFKLLRFSYDRLDDLALQKCLQYCALFPEDYSVEREKLICYLIDEGIIKGMGRRQDAFDEGHTMLNKLQNVCLLESDKTEDGGKYVKMHDLIRDMAIQIMQEMYEVIVKSGAQLKELPDAEYWTENLTRVSLMRNNFEEIPPSHSPMCPNLSTLLLCDNEVLRLIADSFFKEFRGLKVLDLSKTNIQKLPESISDLVSLTALLLTNCKMLRDVPSLKKLMALKRLDLFGTDVMPQGMECLTNLRCLRMKAYRERDPMEFPSGVLPKLSRLQVLALDVFLITVKGKEVGSLRNLETLECNFEGLSDFVEYLRSRNGIRSLSTCKISVGTIDRVDWEYVDYFPSKTVCLGNLSINRDIDFPVKFLNGIQGLYCECIDARSLCDVLSLESATELEIIEIRDCNCMESLVSSSWFCFATPPLPSHNGMFSRLKKLCCDGCNSMEKLFPLELLSYLVNLEEIRVWDCEKMEEIIGTTDEESSTSNPIVELTLPKLAILNLFHLPELKGICSAKLICNSLEKIHVKNCEKLKRMAISLPLLENGQPSPHPSLKKIKVHPKEWWETVVEWESIFVLSVQALSLSHSLDVLSTPCSATKAHANGKKKYTMAEYTWCVRIRCSVRNGKEWWKEEAMMYVLFCEVLREDVKEKETGQFMYEPAFEMFGSVNSDQGCIFILGVLEFIAFIVLCGLTHLLNAWTYYGPHSIRMPMLQVSNFKGGTPELVDTCYAILVLVLPSMSYRGWSQEEMEIVEVVADQQFLKNHKDKYLREMLKMGVIWNNLSRVVTLPRKSNNPAWRCLTFSLDKMVRPNDPFWNDVEDMNDGSMKCKFCGHLFAKDTSISRIKWHLSGERGHGVSICGQVPRQVQEAAFLAIHGGNKRHKSIPSSSNGNLAGDSGRMQVGVQGMEQGGWRGRIHSHVDMENTVTLGVHAHESRGEAAQGTNVVDQLADGTWDQIASALLMAQKLNEIDTNLMQEENDVERLLGAFETIPRTEQVQHLERGSSCERPSINQADEPRGDSSQPSDPLCLDHGRYYDQPFAPSVSNDMIMNDVQNMVRVRTKPVEEHDVENSGRLVQPGAGASSSRILKDNISETRGVPFPTSCNKPVGQAFEENREVIWSLLKNDEVSTIGIYGMGGVGKTTFLQHIHNELLERPDICDHVWWVTVSQDFSINRLQNLIAKRLHIDLSSEDDDQHRAAKLSEELRKKQKWILILDDLWNSFELHDVGIHSSLKGCKLIVTTRSQTVCAQIDCQHKIEVKPLFEGESWALFKENLGRYIALSDEVEGIAKAVARECAGLPLGIITVARSLRRVKNLNEWRNTLKELGESGYKDMNEKVFKVLRVSYDRLDDELALKQCLLYCALFPEDHMIARGQLIGYLIDEGIIKGMGRRQDAFDKGHTMLNRLEYFSLLESAKNEDDGSKCVIMHDLIRDMAIQILQENSQVIVKAGAQLEELPDAEEWTENLTRVSLMKNKIKKIPSSHSPMCPNLSILLLCQNWLESIADSFFKQLHGLKILDLSSTSIENLPNSVSDLVILTALLLRNCRKLRYVPSLEKLRALKSLDLYGTSLEKMPQGMECLSNLRYFRITGCGEKEFPSGILPKLSHLQVLALGEFPMECYIVEGMEVGCLGKLETLECRFKGFSDFVEYLTSQDGIHSLSTYIISVGTFVFDSWPGCRPSSRDTPSKKVYLGNLSINADKDFKVKFLNGIQGLYCECIDARSLCDVLSLENATELELIKFINCDSMESSVSSSWFCSALPLLPSHNGMFSRLKKFSCDGCDSMENLFPLELLPYLVNLEKISVSCCEKMEEIIGTTDEKSSTSNPITELTLPKLTNLYLTDLPELKGICSAKLICNSLKAIHVTNCEKLKRMAISLPLLENGQPSPHPSLERIYAGPKEWWETVVEWEPPNAKEVLRPIVHFW
uniref:NB-ARC domain-containing protein n=1 Tax=Salix viminalis TaxID=40686 RepID=A0A6N2LQU7_SALVM